MNPPSLNLRAPAVSGGAAARRLLATLKLDIQQQWRNGFYFATAFVLIVLALVFSQLRVNIGWLLPILIFSNLPINTFYFVSGLVLLEKGEGTLEAQITSPLRSSEYLFSKLLSLAGLSLLEALLVVWILYGWEYRLLFLVTAVVLGAVLFTLYGFIVVARYDSINSFLAPSILFLAVLLLPLLDASGLVRSSIFYLHPFQAVLELLEFSFGQARAGEALYGLLYGGVWAVILFIAARRSFVRFIIRREGAA